MAKDTEQPAVPVASPVSSGGKADAERVRQASGSPRRRRRSKPEAEMPLTTTEEKEFWGRQVQGFWNGIASARKYPLIPDEQVNAIGEPAALTAKKYLKDAQENHPEYLLLFMLTPYIMGAIRVEWERWTAIRQAGSADPGRERSRVRTEGQREDVAGAETVITRSFTLSDN